MRHDLARRLTALGRKLGEKVGVWRRVRIQPNKPDGTPGDLMMFDTIHVSPEVPYLMTPDHDVRKDKRP